jgi:hypothetical protein
VQPEKEFTDRCRESPALPARLNSEANLARVGGDELPQLKNNKMCLSTKLQYPG